MATRKEVAERAKVSSATVSHVVNNTKYVSPDLKEKVEEAIAELKYVPNRTARNLVMKKTEQVGIVVPSLSNPYYGEIAEGMEEVARRNGYLVSLIAPEGNDDQYISSLLERQMDGVFLATFGFSFKENQLKHMEQNGVRIVGGAKIPNINNGSIFLNYEPAILKMMKYLSELGHRRVAFLSGMPDGKNEPRKDAYLKGVEANQLDFEDDFIIPGNYPHNTTARDGYLDMKKFLARSPKPSITAVFAINDLMALGALKAIRESGLKIPRDISVVGCDDIFLSEVSDPPLTTIHVPKRDMGRSAMELLLAMIEKNQINEVILDTELIIRESTSLASEK